MMNNQTVHQGMVQSAQQYAQIEEAPAPLTTLNHVATSAVETTKGLYDVEAKLSAVARHISGLPVFHGEPAGSTGELESKGVIKEMSTEIEGQHRALSRIFSSLNTIMTHLGMNEPAALNRG